MKSLLISLFFVISVAAFTQQKPGSHDDCIQQVPGDWGPNFGDSWHEHEARYWSCRVGVSVTMVKAWQRAANEMDMADDIQLVSLKGEQLVIFVEMGGTAHCFDVKVLHSTGNDWSLVWRLPSTVSDICTQKCPSLTAALNGDVLTIKLPIASPKEDPIFSCKKYTWRKEQFRWNGKTFDAIN